MYRVLLERAAEKDLARLSSEIHARVIAALRALASNPRPPDKPQAGRQQARPAYPRGRLLRDLRDRASFRCANTL